MRALRAPGAEVDGQPPPRPAPPHGAAPRARALGLSPGELARVPSLRAARPPGGPSSPFAAALASVPAASAGPACVPPGSPRAFPSAAAPERPAARPEKPVGGAPCRARSREPGQRERDLGKPVPQPPRGAAGEDETAASVVSASEVRQENWGGCGGGGGAQLGYPTVWLQPSPPPPPYPTPRPPRPGLQ